MVRRKNKFVLLFILLPSLFFSCSSKEEIVIKSANYTYELVNQARNSEEIDTIVPLGFKLNSTEKEYESNLNKLINNNGVTKGKSSSVTTDYFGWQQEIRIINFHYFTDPNTETDIVSSITFVFDSLRKEPESRIREFLDSINELFDDTWQAVQFQLDMNSIDMHLYKYWIRNNIVVEFKVSTNKTVTLTYHNASKSYLLEPKSFYSDIDSYYNIRNEVRKKNSVNSVVENSPWDGSVYQVKKYLNKTLKDPRSYESIEWGKVIMENGHYYVAHKYRAKNSFGGYVIETCLFELDKKGNVIGVDKVQ